MHRTYTYRQRVIVTAMVLGGILLIGMNSKGAAGSLSVLEEFLEKERQKTIEQGSDEPQLSAEKRTEELRQKKEAASESLSRTIKEIEDREESRAIRDGNAVIVR